MFGYGVIASFVLNAIVFRTLSNISDGAFWENSGLNASIFEESTMKKKF